MKEGHFYFVALLYFCSCLSLSVDQATASHGRMADDLERIWDEAEVAYNLRYFLIISLEGLSKVTKTSVRMTGL